MATQITRDTTIADITPDVLENLLVNDSDEDVYFDFKEGPDSKDPKNVHSVRKTIVSFANTFGGFLFFGVLDKGNTKRQGLDRLVGVTTTNEFGKRITQKYLGRDRCTPVVYFEGPQILHLQGWHVPVIRIPRSSNRPHAIKEAPDCPLEFWTRGTGTALPMDYSHLLSEVDRSREERGWLTALAIDLDLLLKKAEKTMKQAFNDPVDELPERFHSIIQTNIIDASRSPRLRFICSLLKT